MVRKLFQQERQEQIVALLEQAGRVSVVDLGRRFDVSQATIRSDLDALAAKGLLARTHGGALTLDRSNVELSFDVRRQLNAAQKDRIGLAAVEMIGDGEAIALDASTTALALVNRLEERHELTVMTNGLLVALALLDKPGITVLMPGGFMRRDSVSLVGDDGHEFIRQFNFQKGFFGAKGFTLEEGLTDVNKAEVAIKRDLVARCRQAVAIVDSSKWGNVGFASFASVDQLDYVITDEDAPVEMVEALRRGGVEVILV